MVSVTNKSFLLSAVIVSVMVPNLYGVSAEAGCRSGAGLLGDGKITGVKI